MRTPILPLESPTDTTQSSTATSALTSTSQTLISTTLPAPSTNPLAGLPGSSLWVASLTWSPMRAKASLSRRLWSICIRSCRTASKLTACWLRRSGRDALTPSSSLPRALSRCILSSRPSRSLSRCSCAVNDRGAFLGWEVTPIVIKLTPASLYQFFTYVLWLLLYSLKWKPIHDQDKIHFFYASFIFPAERFTHIWKGRNIVRARRLSSEILDFTRSLWTYTLSSNLSCILAIMNQGFSPSWDGQWDSLQQNVWGMRHLIAISELCIRHETISQLGLN